MTELPHIDSNDVSIREVEFGKEHSPDGSDVEGVSIRLEIHREPDASIEFRYRFVPHEDGVGTRYKGYTEQYTEGVDIPASIRNRAIYEAARAVAELTGTRVTPTFVSQEYLDKM
jgi:hypothetical protein